MLSMNAIRPIFKKIRPRFNFSKLFKQSLSSSLIFAKADGVRGGRGGQNIQLSVSKTELVRSILVIIALNLKATLLSIMAKYQIYMSHKKDIEFNIQILQTPFSIKC